MKKHVKSFGALFLASLLAFGCMAGCVNNQNSQNESSNTQSNQKPVETEKYIMDKGKTEYKLVVSPNAEPYVNYAVNEFNLFFKKSTTIELDVISDEGLQLTDTAKYISLGENALQAQAGVTYEEESSQGFVLDTVKSSIFVVGGSDLGVLYGVYELMGYLIDWECFGTDNCYYETNVSRIPLYDFNILSVPDMEIRECGHGRINKSQETLIRMRYQPSRNSLAINGSLGHTSIYFIPPSTHAEEHPEWYLEGAPDRQLCYTARGNETYLNEMVDACVETAKEALKADRTSTICNFSMTDNSDWCTCVGCKQSQEKYGTPSASVIIFLNKLSEKIYDWFETEEGNEYKRELKFLFYAYMTLEAAPVIKDKDGNYKAIAEEVKCNDYVLPQVAITLANYTRNVSDEALNKTALEKIQGWGAIAPNIAVYGYVTNYLNYLIPFNTMKAVQDWYQTYKKYGAYYYYNLGQSHETGSATSWAKLQQYLDSKLGWDVDADMNELLDDYFKGMYGKAADTMRKIYNEYQILDAYNGEENTLKATYLYTYIMQGARLLNTSFWPQNLLERWVDTFDVALQEIQSLKILNPEEYARIHTNIISERIAYNYLKYRLYANTYTTEDLQALKTELLTDIKEAGLSNHWEGNPLESFILEIS